MSLTYDFGRSFSSSSLRKYKAFVGFGNNSSMIKGLLKRRFWWTITDDCND